MNTPYAARRDRLRQLMRARGLDALLVSHAANRFYLSGFELHDVQLNESAGRLVICADGRDWLCTDARYKDAFAARLPTASSHERWLAAHPQEKDRAEGQKILLPEQQVQTGKKAENKNAGSGRPDNKRKTKSSSAGKKVDN